MTLDQARAIIADSSRAPHMADWMVAGRVLYDHWQRNPHLLKPAKLTMDAKPKPRRTRDQAEPTRRRLGPPGSFRIVDDDRGCWLVQEDERVPLELGEQGQTGVRPPTSTAELVNAAGPLPMGAGMMGDRHRRATAARDAGRAFAEAFNQRQRAKWGQ